MNSVVIIIILVLLLLSVIMLSVRVYSSTHNKLEAEREAHDKFERLYKFMSKWMAAEEQGSLMADKVKALNRDVVILGSDPVALVLKSKLDKAGISYRAEETVENCVGAGIVVVTDISRFEKWQHKLDKMGIESVSLEDIFYDK